MKVLFLGNSHTFYNDMPQIFKDICRERGKEAEVTMQAHPDVTYEWHYNEMTELRFALLYGDFDYLVMQQAAHKPCPTKEQTIEYGGKIIDLARKCGVTPIQALPWAEKNDPDHQKEMYEIYQAFSDYYHVKLTCTGYVFEEVLLHHPDINMYWNDEKHASPYGSYAVAMATYCAIFNESVKGLSPLSYCNYPISDENWARIKAGFMAARKEPENKELMEKAYEVYRAFSFPVIDREKTSYRLDPEKASILQDLVDRFGLDKG